MLYHVSLEEIDYFEPRIPSITLLDEDDTTKRICFSNTLPGALSALQGSIKLYDGLINLSNDSKCPAIIHIYSIEEEDVGNEFIIKNRVVSMKVPDAIVTGEVWVTRPIEINEMTHQTIVLTDFEYVDEKFLKNWAIYKIKGISCRFATQKELESNKKFWDGFAKDIKKDLNKELTADLKRAVICLCSKLEVEFDNVKECS